MKVVTIPVGFLSTNCYVLIKEKNCLVIDPGAESNKIKDFIESKKLKLQGILLTHDHPDHTDGLNNLLNYRQVDVYRQKNLKEGTTIIDNFEFEVIYTPGHTLDSITYYFKKDKIMFTGDFLFKESIGRCDLTGGSYSTMKESLAKINKYDNDITIYPGHGDNSTLNYEKKYNSYLQNV